MCVKFLILLRLKKLNLAKEQEKKHLSELGNKTASSSMIHAYEELGLRFGFSGMGSILYIIGTV